MDAWTLWSNSRRTRDGRKKDAKKDAKKDDKKDALDCTDCNHLKITQKVAVVAARVRASYWPCAPVFLACPPTHTHTLKKFQTNLNPP
jgi:hypothetical protein